MERWRLPASLLFALGLLLAGCGQADETDVDADAATDPPATETDAPAEDDAGTDAEASPEVDPADVDLAVADSELGAVLVDGDGMTLYLFTQDPPGESVCEDDCAAAWPPLVVDGEPEVGDGIDPALVGTIVRADGTTQVTYADAPLYTWASDQQPGDVTGQGVQDVWFVVAPDGSPVSDEEPDDEDARDPAY